MNRLSRPKSVLLGVLIFVLTACGNAEPENNEVDFDADGGKVSIENDDGSIDLGSDLEIPDGLSIDVPSGGSVGSVLELDNEIVVALFYDIGEFENLVEFYADWTAEQPGEFDESTNEFESAERVLFKSVTWFGNDLSTSINIVNCFILDSSGDETEQVCLSLSESR